MGRLQQPVMVAVWRPRILPHKPIRKVHTLVFATAAHSRGWLSLAASVDRHLLGKSTARLKCVLGRLPRRPHRRYRRHHDSY